MINGLRPRQLSCGRGSFGFSNEKILMKHTFLIVLIILFFLPKQQKQMIELCRTEGQKLLFEGQYDRVVPAALESLKFSIEVYGLSSIELVPSYLILGEASIGWCFVVYSYMYVFTISTCTVRDLQVD